MTPYPTGAKVSALIFVLLTLPLTTKADSETVFKPYGFIRANFIGSSRAVESFGNMNMSAPTSVSPATVTNSQLARDSFQIAQSRFGTWIERGAVTGHLEFDFIDFTKASPTTQALPRVRIANIDYHLDSNQTISAGQDWDLFSSPTKPFTYNYVGLYFQTGNVGFMRQQIRYSYKIESGWNLGAAVGLLNKNATSTDSEIETTGIPTFSIRAIHQMSPEAEAGLSMILGQVRPSYSSPTVDGVYGLNLFWSIQNASGLKVHGEAYYGQNLASAGALTLANASLNGSRHEAGGYLTTYQDLSERFSIQGGIGIANVFESNGSVIDGISGNTILWNRKAEVALAFHPQKDLRIYIQPTVLQTSYLQIATGLIDTPTAILLEGGMVFQF